MLFIPLQHADLLAEREREKAGAGGGGQDCFMFGWFLYDVYVNRHCDTSFIIDDHAYVTEITPLMHSFV